MKKIQSRLFGLLILQLLIAVGIFTSHQRQQQSHLQQPLLSFDEQQLNRIVVSDGEKTVNLTKTGDHWLLPDLQKLPATESKLTDLLTKLEALHSGWPVATTSSAQKRFDVEKAKFQRRIQLYQDETLLDELYVGTSPGFRKTHIRKAGDNAIYTAALNSYELPVKMQNWFDKSLLASTAIDNIKGPDFVLHKTDGKWTLAEFNTPEGEETDEQIRTELNPDKAGQLASALTGLRVIAVETGQPLSNNTAPEVSTVTLEVAGPDSSWVYRLTQAGDKYTVSRNDRDAVFDVSKFDYDRIASASYAKLVKQPEITESSSATESSDS